MIDGRVVNLFEKRFLEGKIIIPHITKLIVHRQMGAEADRVMNNLKKITVLEFVARSVDGFPEEVCVLKVASGKKAKVITTSDEYKRYLNSFPDVHIINLKELHSLLIPIFIPNKIISVRIVKRGMNQNEGIGYIEGVKIVVSDGGRFVNQTVMARVVSMLQFETGNLVFAELIEDMKEKLSNPEKEDGNN